MTPTKVLSPPGPLQTERLPNGNRKLIRKLEVKLNDGNKITVPKHFETDFSSIPRLARSFFLWSKVDVAGVVHDFQYWCPEECKNSRKHADSIWCEVAGAGKHSANRFQRYLGWIGLRWFGWYAYRKAKKARYSNQGRQCV